jgi:hypothetical protein
LIRLINQSAVSALDFAYKQPGFGVRVPKYSTVVWSRNFADRFINGTVTPI